MNVLSKSLALMSREDRIQASKVLILVSMMALFETVGVASVMPFLSVLGDPALLDSDPLLSQVFSYVNDAFDLTADEFLMALGLGSFIFIIGSAVFRTYTHYVMYRFVELQRHSICVRLLDIYLRQPYGFFMERNSEDLSRVILSEVDQLIATVFRPTFIMLAFALVFICISTFLIVINPWLALAAGGVIGALYYLVYSTLKRRLADLGSARGVANGKRYVCAGEAFGGIKEIKLLGRERSYIDRFAEPSFTYAVSQAEHQTINNVPKYVIEALAFGGIIAIVLVLLFDSGGLGSSGLGDILPIVGLYAFAAYRLQPALQHIFQGFASLKYGKAAVDLLYAELNPTPVPPAFPDDNGPPRPLKRTIEVKNVTFTYPGSDAAVLRDVNLEIPVGSRLGIVGPSGCGKTTLVDILLGLLIPEKGSIAIDGRVLDQDSMHLWQQMIGYVAQDVFLGDGSVAENIAMGIRECDINYDSLEFSAEISQALTFIRSDLPLKFRQPIGEGGIKLSGGQRQRLGVARALYRNPQVLVLDEATSALDAVTERKLMAAINDLPERKTIVMIAHRLSTVKNCDQIILLNSGSIVASGTYEELHRDNELFRRMAV